MANRTREPTLDFHAAKKVPTAPAQRSDQEQGGILYIRDVFKKKTGVLSEHEVLTDAHQNHSCNLIALPDYW
jgi:hypothetical protein